MACGSRGPARRATGSGELHRNRQERHHRASEYVCRRAHHAECQREPDRGNGRGGPQRHLGKRGGRCLDRPIDGESVQGTSSAPIDLGLPRLGTVSTAWPWCSRPSATRSARNTQRSQHHLGERLVRRQPSVRLGEDQGPGELRRHGCDRDHRSRQRPGRRGLINGTKDNVVGGTVIGTANVISGNDGSGVHIFPTRPPRATGWWGTGSGSLP